MSQRRWQVPHQDDLELLADNLPPRLCFLYCALFLAVRQVLTRFRTSNPTWLKLPSSLRHRIAPSWTTLTTKFLASVLYLQERLSFIPGNYRLDPSPFMTASATRLPFAPRDFDAIFTSPPYATRLDYVTSTLPELAVLGADPAYLKRLRKATTGSPVLRHTPSTVDDFFASPYATHTLHYIASHSSKGSRSYYLPWMRQYLFDLQTSLFEIARTVHPTGTICLVVQDSFYKTHHVDLQRIVCETFSSRGRALTCRYDYPASNPRSRIAKAGSPYPTSAGQYTETLLVFG